MDLSNLRTSLREEEISSQRRTAHLRAAEDELNAFFRSSALGLTTLYRQGVAATKASYEKGYAHALAHVLELWDKDRDWLKGYLQRRIEAIEAAADAEDEADEPVMDPPQQVQPQPQPQPQAASQAVGASASTSFNRTSASGPTTSVDAAAAELPRHNNKRSRTSFREASTSHHRDPEDSPVDRRTHHRGTPHTSSTASSRPPTLSSAGFGSSFNFAAPLAYPSTSVNPVGTCTSTVSPSKPSRARSATADAAAGAIIRTSNPRRRLHKLKGLRAGRAERVLDLDTVHDGGAEAEDADAWTDDDDEPSKGARGLKAWAERAGGTGAVHPSQVAEGKVLERLDRRKRRRWAEDAMVDADEPISSAEISTEIGHDNDDIAYTYHS